MDKIYENFSDTNVAVTKVYTKADGFAYADKACKIKISADDLENLFVKGMVVVGSDSVIYKPISCKISNKVATVTYVTTDTTTATTAKLATVKSV